MPSSAYKTVTLSNLDGSGYLKGTWANIANKAKGKRREPRPPRLHLLLHPPYNVQFLG